MNDGRYKIDRGTRPSTVFFLSLAVFAASLAGCVNGPDDVISLPPMGDYFVRVAEGWIEFEAGRYDSALTAFAEASDIDPELPQAYMGLGWGYAMLDGLDDSLSNFQIAIQKEPESPDGYAARAFVYLAQNKYAAAIEAANEAISLGGDEYVFGQIQEVRTRNLQLILAESYYAIGQYSEAQKQVDALKPDNNLDQENRTYIQDLLLEIEELGPAGLILEN